MSFDGTRIVSSGGIERATGSIEVFYREEIGNANCVSYPLRSELPLLLSNDNLEGHHHGAAMHPNSFMKHFWKMEFRPEVFVAMSFDERFQGRYTDVMVPAIHALGLSAKRVDESRTGDSILTEIIEHVAHCSLVLADVSMVGFDRDSGRPYRNGNVMYEVGLALSCRQPHEVLLIRDDRESLLFDTSTIPHKTIDFGRDDAVEIVRSALADRLAERNLLTDMRVEKILSEMTPVDEWVLRQIAKLEENAVFSIAGKPSDSSFRWQVENGIVHWMGNDPNGLSLYRATPLGTAVAKRAATARVLNGFAQMGADKSMRIFEPMQIRVTPN